MNILSNQKVKLILKVYAAVVLLAAAIVSPPAFSIVPVLLLAWFLYQWRRPVSTPVRLLTQYFMYFAVGLFFTLPAGPYFALLISLPLLVVLNDAFEESAKSINYHHTDRARSPTNLFIVTFSINLAIFFIALVFGSLVLILSCATIMVYFAAIGISVLRYLPLKPVNEEQIQLRILAGKEEQRSITLTKNTKVGGLLFIESPYEWFKVSPNAFLPLKSRHLVLNVSVLPALSGPATVKLKSFAIDRWGLMQVQFELEPVKLIVVPRAKYAEWLARKYLAGTKPGELPLIADIGARKPLLGLRRGVEYYGNRIYQPGDSAKNIDWKHSFKYNELIVKEFSEIQGQSAIILINLVAGNAEESDKLAYNMIVTAISLAQEGIPTALAAYTNEGVILSTDVLGSLHLVSNALQMVKEIVITKEPERYLKPPDVERLRANINRMKIAAGEPARMLHELLQLEYKNLSNIAVLNPCSKALLNVLAKVKQQSTILVISFRNHDAEALAFNSFILSQQGKAVVTV